jgi:hypothetical protein
MTRDSTQPVSFRDRNEVLTDTAQPWERKSAIRFEIIRYLHWFKEEHTPAAVTSAQAYLAGAAAGVRPHIYP